MEIEEKKHTKDKACKTIQQKIIIQNDMCK